MRRIVLTLWIFWNKIEHLKPGYYKIWPYPSTTEHATVGLLIFSIHLCQSTVAPSLLNDYFRNTYTITFILCSRWCEDILGTENAWKSYSTSDYCTRAAESIRINFHSKNAKSSQPNNTSSPDENVSSRHNRVNKNYVIAKACVCSEFSF